MSLTRMLSNLPDSYNKRESSNTYKLLSLPAISFDDGRATLETVRAWRDIDNAQGTTLDRIGKNVGQARNGMDDAEYRKRIKVKIRANLSGGEIETINAIAQVFAAARYTGLQEGWTLPEDFPIKPKQAAMLLTIKVDGTHYGIPMVELDAIKGGGVRINWELLAAHEVDVQSNVEIAEQPASVHGKLVQIARDYAAILQSYPMCGTFYAGEEIIL